MKSGLWARPPSLIPPPRRAGEEEREQFGGAAGRPAPSLSPAGFAAVAPGLPPRALLTLAPAHRPASHSLACAPSSPAPQPGLLPCSPAGSVTRRHSRTHPSPAGFAAVAPGLQPRAMFALAPAHRLASHRLACAPPILLLPSRVCDPASIARRPLARRASQR